MVGADGVDSCPPATGDEIRHARRAGHRLPSERAARVAAGFKREAEKADQKKIFRKGGFKKTGVTGLHLKILVF